MSQVELEAARERFEQQWNATRERLSTDLGLEFRRSGWLVLLLAGAVGVATAVAVMNARGSRELPPASD